MLHDWHHAVGVRKKRAIAPPPPASEQEPTAPPPPPAAMPPPPPPPPQPTASAEGAPGQSANVFKGKGGIASGGEGEGEGGSGSSDSGSGSGSDSESSSDDSEDFGGLAVDREDRRANNECKNKCRNKCMSFAQAQHRSISNSVCFIMPLLALQCFHATARACVGLHTMARLSLRDTGY